VNGTISPYKAGNGGNGTASSITGTSVTYAGGGGGGASGPAGQGANGAGGGSDANGGGGGRGVGGNNSGSPSGNGGSGVVVIAYPDSFPAATVSAGLTFTQPSRSGQRVYRFTGGTGTITL
jgi:hypothetical protein